MVQIIKALTHNCDGDVAAGPQHLVGRDAASVGPLVVARDAAQKKGPVFEDQLPLVHWKVLS